MGAATEKGFARAAREASWALGHPVAFGTASLAVVIWAILGPVFDFSSTWQLAINTGTTIATFLMVFLLQNTQNRQGDAIQLKLDELIRAVDGAHNMILDLEDAPEAEIKRLKERYRRLRAGASDDVARGRLDTGTPDLDDSTAPGPR